MVQAPIFHVNGDDPEACRARRCSSPTISARSSRRTSSSTCSATAATATTKATIRPTRSPSCIARSEAPLRGRLSTASSWCEKLLSAAEAERAAQDGSENARTPRSSQPRRPAKRVLPPRREHGAPRAQSTTQSRDMLGQVRRRHHRFLPASFHLHPKLEGFVEKRREDAREGMAPSTGPSPKRSPSAAWCSKARRCASAVRTPAAAPSASAIWLSTTTKTASATSRCSTCRPIRRRFDVVDSSLSEYRGARLRIRLQRGRSDDAHDVGSAVRRLLQRRPDHDRPVHRHGGTEVGPADAASSCCCRTATKARARSTRAPAWSASSRSARRTTSASPTAPRRRSTSISCGARSVLPRSRWSSSRPRLCCARHRRYRPSPNSPPARSAGHRRYARPPAAGAQGCLLQRQGLLRPARRARGEADSNDVALVRLEELYPVPAQPVADVLARYSPDAEVMWCQEEPRNMGAWRWIYGRFLDLERRLKYAGRLRNASPAAGSPKRHAEEQKSLVEEALA